MFPSSRLCVFASAALLLVASCKRTPPLLHDDFPILTPPASATPRINGAKVLGVRPGSPFLFQIAATGERPMEFAAANLPAGLSLDATSGLITGSVAAKGEHVVSLRAMNALGTTERALRIAVGDKIALTPPMGWSSWNCWGPDITQAKIARAARAMAASGLREHGWTYVNVDDGWQGVRGGKFNAIQPNASFPDMAQLADEIHGLGLKFGIYSTPWRTSFLGHIGSSADEADGSIDWIKAGEHTELFKFRFPNFYTPLEKFAFLESLAERQKKRARKKITNKLRAFGAYSFIHEDVAQWTAWGVDYLKYDWVPIDIAHVKPMAHELASCGRDIFYSVANNAAYPQAAELSLLANSWRITGDVKDNWRDLNQSASSRDRWAPFTWPGHYSDLDMLVIGYVGWGKTPRPSALTSDEQYTQVSLWCLLASPLLLGCDLEKLDAFTLGLITNDEVLDVNQDPLCRQATCVAHSGDTEVYAKPLEDGAWAVGFFNRGSAAGEVRVNWSVLKLAGLQAVRDLWRQKDLGVFADGFSVPVASHGAVLLRVTPASRVSLLDHDRGHGVIVGMAETDPNR